MKIYTKIAFPDILQKLDYHSRSVFMGSCFSEDIGGWLSDLKFNVGSNITGIGYNPISISKHISQSINGVGIADADLDISRETFVHTDFHSVFNHRVKEDACAKINGATRDLKQGLLHSDFLFITFGTAIAFERKSTGEIVNNCHHLPSDAFSKRMLDESEMHAAMKSALKLLLTNKPKLHIVLTVSPIRHLRHGAIENSRSKARLIRLCEILEKDFTNCTYLPVYEFVMDELRDYRFYRQDDLIHLNELGLGLIREKVSETIISKEAIPLMERIKKYNAMNAHKIQHTDSDESRLFLKKIELERIELESLLPGRF